jgi:rhamnulose-1-phosphate aldolase
MNKTILLNISNTARLLCQRGWAERNAGNISLNVTGMSDAKNDSIHIHCELPKHYPSLANNSIIVSATNSRMRDIAEEPENWLCLVEINESGSGYSIHTMGEGYENKPTSELHTHLAVHNLLVEKGSMNKAVVHTHPNELIALSHIPEFKSSTALTNLLWNMHPETIIFLPEGVGFVPYTMTGTVQLAEKTLEILNHFRVAVWEKHGCIAVAENPLEAFDLIDTLAKSANIYFTCKSAGFEPEGLTEIQLTELREAYSSVLNL